MKSYLVIGLGKFGMAIAKTLYEKGNTVLAIDTDEELVQNVLDEGIVEDAIILDATNENSLKNIAKDAFDAAFVCIGSNIQDSILVTLILKEMGLKQIICKAETKMQGKVLKKIGATQIVYPEEMIGEKIAYSIMNPSVIEYFKFSQDYSIYELKMPEKFVGKTLMELDLRNEYEMNVIAIKNEKGELNVTPSPIYKLSGDDILIVLGKDKIGELIK